VVAGRSGVRLAARGPARYVAQAGLGSLQRSTGLVRAPGRLGKLPWVISGVVPDEAAGLLPLGDGLRLRYAATAWWWPRSPAAIAGFQQVPCTVRA